MSGIFQPLRFYEFGTGFSMPELSNNTFFCKDYDHVEYFSLNPDLNRLPPFMILFEDQDPSAAFNLSTLEVELFCSETKEKMGDISISLLDFESVQDGSDKYLCYQPSIDFTVSEDIEPGVYFIKIWNIQLDNSYDFYSDSFVIKNFINGTP